MARDDWLLNLSAGICEPNAGSLSAATISRRKIADGAFSLRRVAGEQPGGGWSCWRRSVRLLYHEWFVRLRFPSHEHARLANGIPQGWERVPTAGRAVVEIPIRRPERVGRGEEHWSRSRWLTCPRIRWCIQNFALHQGRDLVGAAGKFRNGDTFTQHASWRPRLEGTEKPASSISFGLRRRRPWFNMGIHRLAFKARDHPEFVYCLARTHDFRGNAIKSMIGSSGRSARFKKVALD